MESQGAKAKSFLEVIFSLMTRPASTENNTLTEAGAGPKSARAASQSVADMDSRMGKIETEIRMLKWMTGLNMMLLIALLGINFQMYMEVLDIVKAASGS